MLIKIQLEQNSLSPSYQILKRLYFVISAKMVESVYSEAQLRSQIIKEVIGESTLYYSLVKKEAKTISILTNERLLVFNFQKGQLFYINQYKNLPFKDKAPKPKNNESASINISVISNPAKTSQIHVQFAYRNDKGEMNSIKWIFICENEQLAKQWLQLFEKFKAGLMSKVTGQKQIKPFIHDTLSHEVLMNLPKQSQVRQSIVKPQQRHETLNQSQIKNVSPQKSVIRNQAAQSRISQSTIKKDPQPTPKKEPQPQPRRNEYSRISQPQPKPNISNISRRQSNINSDWNYKFLKNPHQGTLFQFQKAAQQAFVSILSRDSNNLDDPKRIYNQNGLKIVVCNGYSREASFLKRQYRNYHFIIDSTKNKLVVGVPLTCLIEFQGLVGLVKAPLPQGTSVKFNKQILLQLKDLQRYTRIMNGILQKASIYDLSQVYAANGDKRLIYIDDVIEYLPSNVDEEYSNSCIRPQYILDNVNQLIPGGDIKSINKQQFKVISGICSNMNKACADLAQHLSNLDYNFTDALQLKDIFHENGLNLKYLPKVYNQITNKHIKKYIHTIMAAKIAKDYILETLIGAKQENSKVPSAKVIEDIFRLLIDGNNSNSSEIWKSINLRFKKVYSIPMVNNQLIGGYFLNSLMKLIRANYDITKLNQSKKIFKDQGIIGQGFIRDLIPKSKTYYKFTTELMQKAEYISKEQKKSQTLYDQIVKDLQLKSNDLPADLSLNNNKDSILAYLSYFAAPPNLDSSAPLQHIPIYRTVNAQPPTTYSLKITKNYLQWCNRKQKSQEFKKKIEQSLSIVDYWLDQNHLSHCDLFQLLSDYYSLIGNNEESLNFMKESLSICIRSCGSQSKQAGVKYYELAERQLRSGRKREALQNFQKAKINMETYQQATIKYPMLLMRMASLELNNGNVEGCIQYSMNSIKQFQEYQKKTNTQTPLNQSYKIKTFQILSRAYEINGRKDELKDMAVLCAKKFNKSKTPTVFEQMVRICITAIIFKHSQDKCNNFLSIIQKIKREEKQKYEPNRSLEELMALADNFVVMQKFLSKFDSIERINAELSSKKALSAESREFVTITKYITSCIGEDYIVGLIHQKEYE